jgi:hypothetical protein
LCAGVTHTQGANTTGDGYVSITPLPPTVTSTTSSLSFVDTVGGTSPARVFPLTAFAMSWCYYCFWWRIGQYSKPTGFRYGCGCM